MHGSAVKCDVSPSKKPEIRRFFSDLCRSMVQKDEVSKLFCPKSAHARSFRPRFLRNCNTGMSSPRVDRSHEFLSRNIQVSRSLLELSGRHVIMYQMKVLQVALFRQLAYDVALGFTCCLFAQIEVSSARSRESLDTSCSSKAVGSCSQS